MAESAQNLHTPIELDRDMFMRRLIASLGHLNEGILGSDIAGGYVMNVGLSMGAAIEAEYRQFWDIDRPFTLNEYAHVIVDLKQKINGNFSLVSKAPEKVIVRTTSCPFDEFVRQSPSLCFMTSSVFGGIAARNFGYAKVVLHRRIALGDPGCYVTVHLQRTPEAEEAIGREYFPDIDEASTDIREQLRIMDRLSQLRRQLGETRSRWEELVRGAADAICVLESDGTIVFANARWRDLLGVEAEELVGGIGANLVHPEDRADAHELVARVLRGERVTGRLYRLRHRDESWREVLTSAGPVRDEQGQMVGALIICHDVTHDREVQRLKDEFISSASHELRTPLTTIRALTDLLLRTIESHGTPEPEELAKRLVRIQQEVDRLALLGTDLSDAMRLQAGKLAVKRERQNLTEIAEACAARQREILGNSHRHTIQVRYPAAPVMGLGERRRLEQVLDHLLDNAVKYSPEGGVITVDVGARDDQAYITVMDTGIGVPSRDVSHIFTPFFRGSNTSTRNYAGLGLGLYFSKAILEAHKGDLTVTSIEGEGTAFTMVLPLEATGRS